jgi:hypothetical protein
MPKNRNSIIRDIGGIETLSAFDPGFQIDIDCHDMLHFGDTAPLEHTVLVEDVVDADSFPISMNVYFKIIKVI